MVTLRARSLQRLGVQFRSVIWTIPVVVLALAVVFFVLTRKPDVPRVTVVIAGSPVYVWSCDLTVHQCVVVRIPVTDVVDAVHGLGKYSFDALWRLGAIDPRGGMLLSDSAADALGLTGAWFIGTSGGTLPEIKDGVTYGRQLFSPANAFRFLFHSYQSNIPVNIFWSLAREIPGLAFDQILSVDLSNKPVTLRQPLPDGSYQDVLVPGQVDSVLGGEFENADIRKEAFTTAIFNTTTMPNLGTKAARLLSTAGVIVVSVGNTDKEQKGCTLTGSSAAVQSKTAKIISRLLQCSVRESAGDVTTDLQVYVGTDFSAKYKP